MEIELSATTLDYKGSVATDDATFYCPYIPMRISSSWGVWKPIHVSPFAWKKSSVSGRRIWGNICVREHKFMVSDTNGPFDRGQPVKQYATKKEAFSASLKGK